MSFCRWSSMDYQCDLYCYESDAGFVTSVACNRPMGLRNLLPPPLSSYAPMDKVVERHKEIILILGAADMCPIGGPYDGAQFIDPTPEEFLKRLYKLRMFGYRFPDSVIQEVKETIKQGRNSG